ncbi:peptidase S8 [Nibricoccus aquaticus]|uniref:Peptidase S8 n=1 Tax=Nibricoccus aquaticus TaxID=2576891 RepID=A0A290QHZ9_9BACT|nr:peptidase S8 [Nibricoccus aquaticus]
MLLLVAVWFFGEWRSGARKNQAEDRRSVAERKSGEEGAAGEVERAVGADEREGLARLAARERTEAEWRDLLRRRLERRTAREKEAIVIFKDDEAYRKFQARARAAGFFILRESAKLRAARVRYDTIAAVQQEVFQHVRDYEEIGANAFVDRPVRPVIEEDGRALAVRGELLRVLGVGAAVDRSQWGRGVIVAVLDSGVAGDAAFGSGRLRAVDVGLGLSPGSGDDDGHGTAVASIIAAGAGEVAGVAPAAQVVSVRVTAEDGRSDVFTVSEGIVAAVDAGAKVINISLGGYDTSVLLTRAVDYAEAAGAVIVAASGNDRMTMLAWPAAEARVISVGATDAAGRLAGFSNVGEGLKMTAPGVGGRAAWLGGERVLFSGTSASAPVVSGALAAVMSQKAGRSGREAWEILAARSDDAGAPGTDAEYGAGVLDLGWAMEGNPARVDLAVSSHWIERTADGAAGVSVVGGASGAGEVVDVVVQNRGGFAVAGAVLEIEAGGVKSRQVVPVIAAGASAVLKVPVDRIRVDAEGHWVLRTVVVAPGGMSDAVPENNERVSGLRVK